MDLTLIWYVQFMQRASLSSDMEEADGPGGGLVEKWVAPNIPKPSTEYIEHIPRFIVVMPFFFLDHTG